MPVPVLTELGARARTVVGLTSVLVENFGKQLVSPFLQVRDGLAAFLAALHLGERSAYSSTRSTVS